MVNTRKNTLSENQQERAEEETSSQERGGQQEEGANLPAPPTVTMDSIGLVIAALQEGQRELAAAVAALAKNPLFGMATTSPASPIIHRGGETGLGNETTPPGTSGSKQPSVTRIYSAPSLPVVDLDEARVTKSVPQQGAEGSREVLPRQGGDSSHLETSSYLTRTEVEAMLKASKSSTQYDFDLNPPYPLELTRIPYPTGYDVRSFPQFDGKNGNASRHVGRFVEALGVHSPNRNLRLREFSKSLDGRAYTWYTNLAPGSVHTWEEMAQLFLTKFFDGEPRLTLIDLGRERQYSSEELVAYVQRFKDKTFDCAEQVPEEDLVNMCIAGMSQVYRLHLENLGIQTYRRLLTAASRTAQSVKVVRGDSDKREKRVPMMAAFEEEKKARFSEPQRKGMEEVRNPPPPFKCSMAQVHLILDKWIKDKVIVLPYITKEPNADDKASPRYCKYHCNLRHPTKECWALRRLFDRKYKSGELIFEEENVSMNHRPFPDHGKGSAQVRVLMNQDDDFQMNEALQPFPWHEHDAARVHVLMGEDDSFMHNEFLLENESEVVESYTDATLLEAARGLTGTLAALTPMIAALQDTQNEMKLTLEAISQYIGSKENCPKGKNETSSLLSTPTEENSYITKSELGAMLRNYMSPNVHGIDPNPLYTQEQTRGKGKEGGTGYHHGRLNSPDESWGRNKRDPPAMICGAAQKRAKIICHKKEGKSPPPPFQCSMEQVHLVLDGWIRDGMITLPATSEEPTAKDKVNPRYCRYHRHLRHPTKECWALQRLFDDKYKSGKFTPK